MRVADTHCHLADLPDPDAAVTDAAAAGVGPILAVAMGRRDGEAVLELRRRHPGLVLAGLGLHPSRVPGLTDEAAAVELAWIAARAREADVLGEVGLDFRDATDPRQRVRQRDILEHLLDIATRCRLPLNLHTRRADRELFDVARDFTARTGLTAVLHWFTHSAKMAWLCAEAGLFISVGPAITHDPAQAEVARRVHPDLLLVETDSPVVYGGVAARPADAAIVASTLARLRGEEEGALTARLARNLDRYLARGPS